MNDSKTIQYNRNIINKLNLIYSLIPKRVLNTDSNIPSIKERKMYSYRDFPPIKIKTTKNINNILSINNSSLSSFNESDTSNNYFFKALRKQGKKLSFSCKKYKKYPDSPKQNKSGKISLKILNEFFKPKYIKKIKNKNKKAEIINNKIYRKQYCSTQSNKINSSNNNLCYYFPNLFNVPYNKIASPDKHLNTSRFFFKNLKELKYDENVKNFTLFRKSNNSNENDNSKSKFNNENNEPIFIEKEYSFNVLRHLRFNFKNLVEKGKHKNFVNSFYITKNLKFNNN